RSTPIKSSAASDVYKRQAILPVKLMYEMARSGARTGLVTMCIGGGQGISMLFEREGA
ncbi:hypothetical protein ELO10_22970, partial [Klebsiella pneumoniae]|nr:hypothetical protein [Klebsiella pneumoniae]